MLTISSLALLISIGLTVSAVPLEKKDESLPPKIIMDNDWLSNGYIPFLMALHNGWDVMGLVSSTCDTWSTQTGLHALATLEIGGLSSCIPVYKGSDYPLLNRPGTSHAWEDVHGVLPFQGAFANENLTAQALGANPTGGNPRQIVRAAFVEGFPNITFQSNTTSAAQFMVEQVQRYPGEVTIYCAGALTNVALAVRLDDNFASNVKALIVMGGYIDDYLLQAVGSRQLADDNSDINLLFDPEASKMVLSADFPAITLVGNAANQVVATQYYLDEVSEIKNVYTTLFHDHYGTGLPFWDETAAAVALNPTLIVNSTSFYVDVDTSYASPSYGNVRPYQESLMPKAQALRKIDYPFEVNTKGLLDMMKNAMQSTMACVDGRVVVAR